MCLYVCTRVSNYTRKEVEEPSWPRRCVAFQQTTLFLKSSEITPNMLVCNLPVSLSRSWANVFLLIDCGFILMPFFLVTSWLSPLYGRSIVCSPIKKILVGWVSNSNLHVFLQKCLHKYKGTCIHTTRIFIVALCLTMKNWKIPQCLWGRDGLKNMILWNVIVFKNF